jgi:putative hydrolase of the HAD superfamily
VPAGVRAVFFDAVGTVLHPEPAAAVAYHAVARQLGSSLDLTTIKGSFRTAFLAQEQIDRESGLRTDEEREVRRWRSIVAEVLSDLSALEDRETAFQTLYAHFSSPSAWRVDPDAGEVLTQLSGAGFRLGLASNFDHRLRGLVAALPDLAPVRDLVISSEVGWRKPASGFFEKMCEIAGLPPSEVLLVGDDLENDYLGGRSAGLPALLLDPAGDAAIPEECRLRGLLDLLTLEGGGRLG